MDRIPASERIRERLKALMSGHGDESDLRSDLVCLAARLIIEEGLEGEATDALGREYYGRGAAPGTTNAIERLHEEFKRRIKTQSVLPSADTAAMLFWALLASGQISMHKVDGWQTLATEPIDQPIDLAA